MSFSGDVKRELCAAEVKKGCCKKAELAGLAAFCAVMRGNDFVFRTENEGVMLRIRERLGELFGVEAEMETMSRGDKGALYALCLPDNESRRAVLTELGLVRGEMVKFAIDPFLTQDECCARAFLRGAFLGGGSVNSPRRSYHFEIETHYFGLSRDLVRLFDDLGVEVKTVLRKSGYVTYIKDSELIGDVLAMMGATSSMMELYNAKIEKEVNNSVNRRVNCDTANLTKTVNASVAQIHAIRRLVARRGAEAIPEHLRALADLRLAYPEASLSELGEMLEPPISKSGVNHRLRKLMELAER